MFSFWEYSNLRIGKFFLIKLWTRCCGKWVYVLPHLICTQVYEINTVFISILDKRKIRQGGRVICRISHSPVESGVEHRQSNPKTETRPLLRQIFAQGHTWSNDFWWSVAAGRFPEVLTLGENSIWLWGCCQVTSALWARGTCSV